MLEQQWDDNSETVEGSIGHHNVHLMNTKIRHGTVLLTNLAVVSYDLNLYGRCDVVEARACSSGIKLPFIPDLSFSLYPIEYKHGAIRSEYEYELQLCAQAICLEEMYKCQIPKGALYYINSKRRKEIQFDNVIRNQVKETARDLSELLISEKVPSPEYSVRRTVLISPKKTQSLLLSTLSQWILSLKSSEKSMVWVRFTVKAQRLRKAQKRRKNKRNSPLPSKTIFLTSPHLSPGRRPFFSVSGYNVTI